VNTLTAKPKNFAELVYAQAIPWRRAALVIGGAALVAALAQLSLRLPFTPVPVSGQTLGVLLVGAALGSSLGFRALLLYLAAGIAGLPVFAAGGAGPGWLLGPTGGYLVAFPLAAWVAGRLTESAGLARPLRVLVAMLAASAVIYLGGLLWLGVYVQGAGQEATLGRLLELGFYPFVAGDLLKAALAAGLLPGAWRLARSFGGI